MADIDYVKCKKPFLGIYLLCAATGLILLYAVLLTICTCVLCRKLRWYARNFGREPRAPGRRLSGCCPCRRVCAVEMVCCCLGCKVALPVEQNPISEGPPTSADVPRGNPENGYERVVSHTVAKPDDYYIVPENPGRVVPMQTEESGGSNIYEQVPPNRSNFRRHRTPVGHSSLSGTYATVLHSDSRSPRASLKSGPNSNVSASGAGVSGVTQQAPRLISAGSRSRNESMVDSEYQPLLSGAVHGADDYTELHEQQHSTAQADTHPVSLPGMRLKNLTEEESTVDDEVPRLPRKYLTEGSTRRKHRTEDQH